MYTRSTSAFIYLLAVSIFQVAVIATEDLGAENTPRFAARQTTTPTVSCLEYATVANLSTIGTNSTFRAAFLQASPSGTDKSAGILDGATTQLKTMIDDEALNSQCGNATAIAIQQAPINLTHGIVGPFKIKQTNAAASNARSLEMVIMMVLATMGASVLL